MGEPASAAVVLTVLILVLIVALILVLVVSLVLVLIVVLIVVLILVLVIVLHIDCTPFLIWVTTTVCPFYTFLFTPSE